MNRGRGYSLICPGSGGARERSPNSRKVSIRMIAKWIVPMDLSNPVVAENTSGGGTLL
jgi:hypothetical protein